METCSTLERCVRVSPGIGIDCFVVVAYSNDMHRFDKEDECTYVSFQVDIAAYLHRYLVRKC